MTFRITSRGFNDKGGIPVEFTCDGEDKAPQLSWEGAPSGTMSFALLADDPDAPSGTFTHWVVYDIPASLKSLEGRTDKSKQGLNDFGRTGYNGPCPPRGHGEHRYFFTLKALDVESLKLPSGAKRKDVEKAMNGHVIGEARIRGTYKR